MFARALNFRKRLVLFFICQRLICTIFGQIPGEPSLCFPASDKIHFSLLDGKFVLDWRDVMSFEGKFKTLNFLNFLKILYRKIEVGQGFIG